jgi:putative CocE/NonD family hydrolase
VSPIITAGDEIVRSGPEPVSPLAREVFVRMRDGIRLATDVYLPDPQADADVPGDTVLIRLPYDKSGAYTFIPLIAEYFMAHGYRVVAQDVRGKYRSEGAALLFVNEADDGYDTLDWIAHQGWSNGRVAMWGDSYYGYTQFAAAATEHPALVAIAPRVTGTQLGEPVRFEPGARVGPVEWAITYLYPLTYFHSQDTYFWPLDLERRPFSAQAEEVMEKTGSRSISYDQWYPHAVHLPRFPRASAFDSRPVPTLQTVGWWDNCAPLSWADIAEIRTRPSWALGHYLRIESIDHEAHHLLDPADTRVEERTPEQQRALLPRLLDPALAFFDVFVRGNGSPDDIPRVSWNLAHTEGMRESATWPPAGTTEHVLAATAEGRLVVGESGAAERLEWIHDPADLVPSSVGNAFAFLAHMPDESALGERADVVVFETAPVGRDVDLTGPVRATATVGSDGPVLDFFVRLLDVSPDGSALRIARGQVQVRDATTPARVDIDLGQLGYRLVAGHRLRVHVSSSDFPEFIPQPGTGDEPWGAVAMRPNRQHLTVGGADGFRLTLTVSADGASDLGA